MKENRLVSAENIDNEEELSLVDSMVGGEATPTVVDLSENEIHKTLNNIIGGE